MRPIQSKHDFTRFMNAAKAHATLAAWQDVGAFDALLEGPRTLEELPGNTRALSVTLPILLHLRIVYRDGADRLVLTPVARQLVSNHEMPGERTLSSLADLGQLGQVLHDGEPLRVTEGGVTREDREASARFLDMLFRSSADSAELVRDVFVTRIPAGAHVLDLGGGHGRYARTLVDAGYEATIMDFPVVIELARERHGDEVGYVAGDFLAGDDLGGPYDAVLVSNIVHGQSEEENAELVRRIHDALAPGGWVLLKDMFLDDRRRDPESAVFFNLTMLLYTRAGRSYALREAATWCHEAGFETPDVVAVNGFTLVMAHKPE